MQKMIYLKNYSWFVLFLFSGFYYPLKAEKVIYINTQEDFNQVSGKVYAHLRVLPEDATETITVYFSGGTYRFNNGPFSFTNWKRPNVSIHFTAQPGETVHLIGDGNEYSLSEATMETATHYFVPLKGAYNRGEMYVDQDFNLVPIANSGSLSDKKIHRAASRHETVRKVAEGKYTIDCIRFKLPEELSFLKNKDASFFRNSLICFKIWFGHAYGTIEKTDDEYIYVYYRSSSMFQSVEAEPGWDSFKGSILFYITNITRDHQPEKDKILVADGGLYIPKGVTTLYECKRQLIAWIADNQLKEMKFSNLHFSGASNFDYEMYYNEQQANGTLLTYDGVSYYRATLISISNTENVTVENCTFQNIGSHSCISVGADKDGSGTGGFVFRNNQAYDIGGKVVGSHQPNTVIDHNRFHRVGLFYDDRPDAITVTCRNYQVTHNQLSDFSGNGMTIGYNMCTFVPDVPVSGVAEGNELFFTSEFLNHLERYTLEDVHAIYMLNHQDHTVIRGNVVHDFEGYKFANGTGRCNNKAILIDCEGYNIHVTGNLAFNLGDFSFLAHYDDGFSEHYLTNVTLENNLFFAPYQLIGNPLNPTTIRANNNYMALDMTASNHEVIAGLPQIESAIQAGGNITDNEAVVKDGKCYPTKDYSSLQLSSFVQQWLVDPSVSNEKIRPDSRIWISGRTLYIRSSSKQTASLYSIDGRLVNTFPLHEGTNSFLLTVTGYYIVRLNDNTSQKVYAK